MNKRKEILKLLKKEDLTAKELSGKTGISIEFVRVYLGQFIKEKKVIIIDPTKGWHKKYRTIKEPLELLKQLYDLMDSKMKYKKTPINEDVELVKDIEWVIK